MLDVDKAENVTSEYLCLVNAASDRCGIALSDFVREFDLRGALIDRFILQGDETELILDLVTGDKQRGYFALSLVYTDRSYLYSGEDLGTALDFRSTRVRFDEFDLDSGGKLHHRFLLWPKSRGEIDIQFAGLKWTMGPLPNRAYQNFGEVLQRSEPLSTETE